MTLYAILPFSCFTAFLCLGAFVLFGQSKTQERFLFSLLCFEAFYWQFVWFFSFFSTDDVFLTYLAKIAYLAISFLPFTVYHFIVTYLKLKHERKLIYGFYTIGLVMVLLLPTDLFVKGFRHFSWGNFASPGPLYPIYVVSSLATVARSIYILARAYGSSVTYGASRNQLRYIFLGLVLYYCCAVDFFQVYGAPWYPPGVFFFLASFTVICYAIVKHRLMDIQVAISRAAVFLIVYAPLLVLPFAVGKLMQPWLFQRVGVNWWMAPMAVEAVFAAGGLVVYRFVQRKTEDRILAEQIRYQRALVDTSKTMQTLRRVDQLLRLIVLNVARIVRVSHVAIYLYDKSEGHYVLKAQWPSKTRLSLPESVSEKNRVIQNLLKAREPLVSEELRLQNATTPTPEGAELNMQLNALNAALLVPASVQEFLLGFLILGEKKSGRMYTEQDLRTFALLSNQAGLAIENALAYEQLGKSLADQFHEHRLHSIGQMGAGVGHQIGNRFNIVSIVASTVRMLHIAKLKQSDLTLEQRALVNKIEKDLGQIEEDALRGGEVARTLTTFSRKTEGYKPVLLEDAISGALTLLQCKFSLEEINLTQLFPRRGPQVYGNLNQLQDVFFNLLDNAHDAILLKEELLKSGELKGQVGKGATWIRAQVVKDYFQIEVEDSGIGMTPQELDQLFIPFFTRKGTAEKGTGLGLSVIKRMIDAHKGTIRAASTYGQGTVFTLSLPLASAVGRPGEHPQEHPGESRNDAGLHPDR